MIGLQHIVSDHLHQQLKYCHGDLKPGNVLLYPCRRMDDCGARLLSNDRRKPPFPPLNNDNDNGDGDVRTVDWEGVTLRLVLCDFGLATPINKESKLDDGGDNSSRNNSKKTSTVDVIPSGTKWYCSPKGFQTQRNQGCKGDMWALAVMIWELLDQLNHPVKQHVISNRQQQQQQQQQASDDAGAASAAASGSGLHGSLQGGGVCPLDNEDDFWDVYEAIESLPLKAMFRRNGLALVQSHGDGATMGTDDATNTDDQSRKLSDIWEFICTHVHAHDDDDGGGNSGDI
jgi:serine/threonine protein kinase